MKNKVILLLFLMILFSGCLEGDVLVGDTQETITYINVSNESSVGLTNVTVGNLSLLSAMNEGYWEGSEQNSQSWDAYFHFYNVTKFNYVDLTSRYFSTSGTPSAHEVELMIYCTTHRDWIELKDYHNEDHWYSRQYGVIPSEHFIQANGTVSIRIEHYSNGINTHRIYIDVLRLIYKT